MMIRPGGTQRQADTRVTRTVGWRGATAGRGRWGRQSRSGSESRTGPGVAVGPRLSLKNKVSDSVGMPDLLAPDERDLWPQRNVT